jgi:ligand-binding sensor domain-containing protein
MKSTTLLFFSILAILTSCNGQTSDSKNLFLLRGINVRGDTVHELGSSIMVIYQDRQNTYWFGSWETGVYRYDGKTLINYTTEHGLYNNRVEDIEEDKSGNIYFTGMNPNAAVTRFDGKLFTNIVATPSKSMFKNFMLSKCKFSE